MIKNIDYRSVLMPKYSLSKNKTKSELNEVNKKVKTKINIKCIVSEFGIAPDAFLLV